MDKENFAIVKVSGDVFSSAHMVETTAAALSFLYRLGASVTFLRFSVLKVSIGLIPVVIHGAGMFSGAFPAQYQQALAEAQSADEYIAHGIQVIKNANQDLCTALKSNGSAAMSLIDGVFSVDSRLDSETPRKRSQGKFL